MTEEIKKFKLASPGVYTNITDNSQLENTSNADGPTILSRTPYGPGLRPVRVQSRSELVSIFGNPVAGGRGDDVWRNGNTLSPTYGLYAAMAYLKNSAPVNVVRLLGASHTDATAAGKAGWETQDSAGDFNGLGTDDTAGGAYGIFLMDSGSATTALTGALAAVLYVTEGSVVLSGTIRGTSTNTASAATVIESLGVNQEFKLIVRDSTSAIVEETAFNFNENSPRYIRKVLNTNPTLTNAAVTTTANLKNYWLGETFERHIGQYVTASGASANFGLLLGLKGDAGTKEGSDYRLSTQAAQTGWVISQDLQVVTGAANSYNPENMTKLFRFIGIDTGEWASKNLKISIEDIKAPSNTSTPYGTFTVRVRKSEDNDAAVKAVETFTLCSLDPTSQNYIAKKIGDMYVTWDDTERRYVEYGNFENRSKFVRVEVNQDVENGAINSELLPFGFFGPVRHKGFAVFSGSAGASDYGVDAESIFSETFVKGRGSVARPSDRITTEFIDVGDVAFTASFKFPELPLRTSATDSNLSSPKEAYWGSDSTKSSSPRFDESYRDVVRPLAEGYDTFSLSANETEHSFIFSLDDLTGSGTTSATYASGSRTAGTSLTAVYGSYKEVLSRGFDKFTMPLVGGFDGLDITEIEPFRNTGLSGGTETTNYAFNSLKRAIDSVSDPNEVKMNAISAPGITNTGITNQILDLAERRQDCIAIIDLEGGYVPPSENTNSEANRLGSYSTVIANLEQRNINTYVGAAYHPWLRYTDPISGVSFWGPPSIAALGSFAYTEAVDEVWYAPAGIGRGGLSSGAGGIPVVNVRERLKQSAIDDLYDSNINPIQRMPDSGIVIWGQKTLQMTPSALDRINVVRMLTYVTREVSKMAEQTIFQPNVEETWNGFLSKAIPFLDSIKRRFGVDDYRLLLDRTTTTPELIDRNIIYAKLYLKPTKAVEFFAIDVTLESSGASFL